MWLYGGCVYSLWIVNLTAEVFRVQGKGICICNSNVVILWCCMAYQTKNMKKPWVLRVSFWWQVNVQKLILYLFIAVTLCTFFYSDFKISCSLFCHADFKQSHSVIFNLFIACIIYIHYVGKDIFLLCAGYRKYTWSSSLWEWVGLLYLGVGF